MAMPGLFRRLVTFSAAGVFGCFGILFTGTVTQESTNAIYEDLIADFYSQYDTSKLQEAISADAGLTDGIVGVGIVHLESGREVYLNADEPFPMASTVKVPVAVTLMYLIDEGDVSLDTLLTVDKYSFSPGSGSIKYRYKPGQKIPLRYLLEQMLTVSDNSATDMIMRMMGGCDTVKNHIAELGIDGMTVDRTIFQVLANCWGVATVNGDVPMTIEQLNRLQAKVTSRERLQARQEYVTDVRDTSSPKAMAQLLGRIWQRDLLSEESSELLIDIMGQAKGDRRIKGMLPAGTKVYHKTGTIQGGLSDVGIVELPNNTGHVVVAVFVKGGKRANTVHENAMAKITRDAYDFFVQGPDAN